MYGITKEKYAYKQINQNPSFSSSLLDQIYRSIDRGNETNLEDSRFYRESMRMQSRICKKGDERAVLGENEKWVDKKLMERVPEHNNRLLTAEFDRKSLPGHLLYQYNRNNDRDAVFFSSTSSSSDSRSSVFSSSDTELMNDKRPTKSSSFSLQRPKPVRTGGSEKKEKKKQGVPFFGSTEILYFDDYGLRSDNAPKKEENLMRSKTRAMKIYKNLKKVKQPLSPGGRFASFINSLFSATNTQKSPIKTFDNNGFVEKSQNSFKSGHVSRCSSASSFSRSCLSKQSSSARERLRNGVNRSVRFNPDGVIIDEDLKSCGQKGLHLEHRNNENRSRRVSVSVPNTWQTGKMKSPTRRSRSEEEIRGQVMVKSRRMEEMASEILREYEKKDAIRRNVRDLCCGGGGDDDDDDDDDDDGMSCSSSELFELDLIGRERYMEELPVYETTHFETNRAIASRLIL